MTDFEIKRIGLHGDGITDEGIFAPLALPSEIVSGVVDGKMLKDVRIITPSSERVSPACRHFKSCGGCQMQHANDGLVARWKADMIRQALAAHGITTDIKPIHTSPPQSRRRAGFSVRRTKKGALAGFHARQSDVIIEVPDCRLVEPEILNVLPALEQLAVAGASRKGELAVMVTTSAAGLDVSVRGGVPLDGPLAQRLAELCGELGFGRLTWDGEVVASVHPPTQRFGRANVLPPPGAFLQATEDGEVALVNAVRAAVGPATRVADLFAGCGTFSLPLAEQAEVDVFESASDMLAALDHGARQASGLKPVTTHTRDLFRRPLLPDELARYDGVVLDPPRAGAEAQVAQFVNAAVPRLAYVSCNPVSFARDAAVLVAGGYRLDWILPVDQFRWSAHVELAAQFSADEE